MWGQGCWKLGSISEIRLMKKENQGMQSSWLLDLALKLRAGLQV